MDSNMNVFTVAPVYYGLQHEIFKCGNLYNIDSSMNVSSVATCGFQHECLKCRNLYSINSSMNVLSVATCGIQHECFRCSNLWIPA